MQSAGNNLPPLDESGGATGKKDRSSIEFTDCPIENNKKN